MKEVDLVPEENRTPLQHQRTALIKAHRALIESMVLASPELPLSETVVVVMDEDAKKLLWPIDLVALPSAGNFYFMLGPREGFREYLEAALPLLKTNTLFAKLDEPPPPRYVSVVVAAFGGVVLAALGEFIVPNSRTPKSPNN